MKKSYHAIAINTEKGIYTTEVSKKPQVEVRQEVITSYPSAKLGNRLADPLFTDEEAGITSQNFTETRVTWIPVGNITDIAKVEAKLKSLVGARIYKTLSLKPILTENDLSAINNGLTTFEHKAEKQRVTDKDGNFVDYKLGVPQYRRLAFSAKAHEDVDLRDADFKMMEQTSAGIKATTVKTEVEEKEMAS